MASGSESTAISTLKLHQETSSELPGRVRAAFEFWLSSFRLSVLLPLILVCGATLVLRLGRTDVWLSRLFFDELAASWPFLNLPVCQFLYRYGVYPAWILVVGSILYHIAGKLRDDKWLANGGLFCVVVMAIGPGLLVNTVLKPNSHRPRPNQIAQFGGQFEYVPVLSIGAPDTIVRLKSFPSGHASMGFFLAVPALALYRRRPYLAATFLIAGVAFGAGIGFVRVAQGRHFVSDVVWAAAFVYFTAVTLHYVWGAERLTGGLDDLLTSESVKPSAEESDILRFPTAPQPFNDRRRAA